MSDHQNKIPSFDEVMKPETQNGKIPSFHDIMAEPEPVKKKESGTLGALGSALQSFQGGGQVGTSVLPSDETQKKKLTEYLQAGKVAPTKEDYAAAISKQKNILPAKKVPEKIIVRPSDKEIEAEAVRRFSSPSTLNDNLKKIDGLQLKRQKNMIL